MHIFVVLALGVACFQKYSSVLWHSPEIDSTSGRGLPQVCPNNLSLNLSLAPQKIIRSRLAPDEKEASFCQPNPSLINSPPGKISIQKATKDYAAAADLTCLHKL